MPDIGKLAFHHEPHILLFILLWTYRVCSLSTLSLSRNLTMTLDFISQFIYRNHYDFEINVLWKYKEKTLTASILFKLSLTENQISPQAFWGTLKKKWCKFLSYHETVISRKIKAPRCSASTSSIRAAHIFYPEVYLISKTCPTSNLPKEAFYCCLECANRFVFDKI